MGAPEWTLVGIAVITLLFGLIGWSLNRQIAQFEKDQREQKRIVEQELRKRDEQIDALFRKHDSDAAALVDLRLQLEGKHYERGELDLKFRELGETFKDGFKVMGTKLDVLVQAITAHIGEHNGVQRSGRLP